LVIKILLKEIFNVNLLIQNIKLFIYN
jgi:hypothetical protein